MAAIQQRVKNLRGSEYFPYPLYVCMYLFMYLLNVILFVFYLFI